MNVNFIICVPHIEEEEKIGRTFGTKGTEQKFIERTDRGN
jgi:hypothetical protein